MKRKDVVFFVFLVTFPLWFLSFTRTSQSQVTALDTMLESVWLIQRNDLSSLGTGFLASPEGFDSLAAFVSNKHILKGKRQILLRINKSALTQSTGERDFIRVRVDLAPPDSIRTHVPYYFSSDSAHFAASYYEHPNDSIDVACFLVPLWRIFPNYAFTPQQNIKERIKLGDSVFILTYPLPNLSNSLVGRSRNLPMIRSGIVARILNDPIKLENGFIRDVILIDAQIFSGNSGSPVILNTERDTDKGKVLVHSLAGMIVGHFPMGDLITEVVIQDRLDTLLYSKQNYGIAVIQQSDKILDVFKLIPAFAQQ